MPEPTSLMAAEARKVRDCLQSVDFLYRLKVNELDLLLTAMKKRTYPADFEVIKQGDKGDAFYMVGSGRLDVNVKKGFHQERVATLLPGQYFGEGALVNARPRSATVRTTEKSELYILAKEDFQKILMANPGIAQSIKAEAAKRKT